MKTDLEIQKDVIAELNWEPSVNPTDIGVEVKDGIVTLSGYVGSYAEKCNAEHAAQRVYGVQGLAVEIAVKLSGFNNRSDADIARTVENVLLWTTDLPKTTLKVMVEDGWITLSGEVDWEYQKRAAVDAVRYLMGVKGVSDDIHLKPRISVTLIKADIEDALKRRARNDARDIKVDISGSEVTLGGVVHSSYERDLASHSAWCAPGVLHVKNNMTIE
ncbi:BON domain-containing protein [Methylomonas paludis]|jgi:osmotically-inducible protein OsmY|uniref:BON domain-containing protein n=1 Tax=Methylomonas paludis TaxID=1173101 RepID=A0A975MR82_9GAMM|nr:BON domain-containing protein [Methylomonas paludis]QWF72430.1 BON domain-containing protein [Methylomonas paludis]